MSGDDSQILCRLPVARDCFMTISFSGHLTQEAIDRACTILQVSKDVFPHETTHPAVPDDDLDAGVAADTPIKGNQAG